jgi:hypothetical protein
MQKLLAEISACRMRRALQWLRTTPCGSPFGKIKGFDYYFAFTAIFH